MGHNEGWPPSARLHYRREFRAVLTMGKTYHSPYFVLKWLPNDRGEARLGLQVSRRVSKKAVERNKIKRWAREIVRRKRARMPAVDLVLIPKKACIEASFDAFREELERALRVIEKKSQGDDREHAQGK